MVFDHARRKWRISYELKNKKIILVTCNLLKDQIASNVAMA